MLNKNETKIDEALNRAYEEFGPFSGYHKREKKTYRFLLDLLLKYRRRGRVLDLGSGMGIMPLALKFLGFDSCGADKYIFNHKNLDKLREIWQKNNLKIYQCDAAAESEEILSLGEFDVILSSSTIEHIKSPRLFLENIRKLLKTGGFCIILTPNLSFISKRIRFLLGFSPYGELKDFFESDGEKFTGHWREYTLGELKQMSRWSEFKIIKTMKVDNSPLNPKNIRDLYYLILKFVAVFLPSGRRAAVVILQK